MYALYVPLDQTIGYVAIGGGITTTHYEARLYRWHCHAWIVVVIRNYRSRKYHREIGYVTNPNNRPKTYIEKVDSELLFRLREDTW